MKEQASIQLVDKKTITPIGVLEGVSVYHLPKDGVSSLLEIDLVLAHEAVFLETQVNNQLLAPKRDALPRMSARLDTLVSHLDIPTDINARREWMNRQADMLEQAGHPYWRAYDAKPSGVTAISVYELNKKI